MLTFEKAQKLKEKDAGKPTNPMEFLKKNKKLVIGGVILVAICIGGFIVYKKVILPRKNKATGGSDSAGTTVNFEG